MSDLALVLIVISTFAVLAWFVQPHSIFVVRIRSGEVSVTKGIVRAAFLEYLDELCREYGVESGTVSGLKKGQRIQLRFSSDLDSRFQQRVRNCWIEEE